MRKIKKEVETKIYKDDGTLIEKIKFYHYDNEKEKLEHSREMQKFGWEDSGYEKENLGTNFQPNFVFVGYYTKNTFVKKAIED